MQIKDVNALTKEQIEELKARHGKLFKTTVCDVTYLCRLLYGPDWDIINKMRADNPRITLSEIDEKIVNLCLLGPLPTIDDGGWATRPAGVLPSLSTMIRAKSGFIVDEYDGGANIVTEDLDEDMEMVKPSDAEKAALKATCNYGMKGVGIGTEYFVVRPIARNEFKQILASAESQTDQDQKVAERAVLWPKKVDWDKKPAGYCDTLYQVVMAISGFSGPSLVEDL